MTMTSQDLAPENPLLVGPNVKEIRRKYAQFQRLMTELMWECLVGGDEALPNVRTLWVYQDSDGQPLRHELHLPRGEVVDGQPVYNRYHKAFYLLEDTTRLESIKQRLGELAKVQAEAKLLAGLPPSTTSQYLLFPDLREHITTLRFWRKERFSSHRRTKEQILNILRKELADKRTVTQQKYEPKSFGTDPVLQQRYADIAALETQLELVMGLEDEHYRERRRYRSTLAYLYDEQGSAEQLEILDVGLIVFGKDVQVVDMDQVKPKRRADRRSFRPEPLVRLEGREIFIEAAWQAFKNGG
jgi:hypothetical protein